jgi:hypothetical protein
MTWYVELGGPHGGPLPTPVVTSLSVDRLFPGDTVVISGSGFTPGTTVTLNPGNIIVGVSMPTVTDEITVTLPFNLPNIKHTLTVSNGNEATPVDLFIVRDVTFTNASAQEVDVLIGELN